MEKINETTFKQKFDKDFEVEIGDSKSPDFKNQLKVLRWDNECNFSVRLIDNETDVPIIKTEGNKIKLVKEKIETHFYPTKIGEKKETDAYEFEVILKEKPKTNKVEMSIETKGLKFFYQPELTQKEKDGGANRPEDVIGSYAVYHESKQGDYSKMGLKNYRAGKAFHIYRPKIIDSVGTEVWGELNIDIEKKLLTVKISQEFLDNAVYPVKHAAGLEFGYHNDGSTTYSKSERRIHGYKFSLGSDGTATSISARCCQEDIYWGVIDVQYGLYNSSLVLQGNTENITQIASDDDTLTWRSADIDTGGNLTTGDIWICFNFNHAGTKSLKIAGDTGDANYAIYSYGSVDYDDWRDPLNVDGYTNEKYSIYCTYTASGGTATGIMTTNKFW